MSSRVMFSSVIDELTDSIQRFAVIRNETAFESELDVLMGRMESASLDPLDKWEILQANYSKLKYLHETVNFYNLPSQGKFMISLEKFMDNIDRQNQYYLGHIDWDSRESEFKIEGKLIKRCLKSSLNRNDPINKLADVLKAYEILVCIVEDFRGEKCENILEPEFLDEFEPPKKRAKV